MGPRRGKRTLGVAALILAVLAAATVVLLSHGDKSPVRPVDETAAKAERHEQRALAEKDPIGPRIPNASTRPRRIVKRIIRIKRSGAPVTVESNSGRARRSPARSKARGHTKRRRSGKKGAGHKGAPVTPSTAPGAATPSSPPAASAPPAAVPAQPTPAPEERPVEIQIADGDLATGFNFIVYSRGERVRLHISSDQSVVVTIPGYGVTQPVAAGGGALIEFDATSSGLYEVKLQGNRGMTLALLRVRD